MIILYNILSIIGVFLLLPLILPLIAASGKRQKTVLQRLGLKGLPHRTQELSGQGSTERPIWIHALSVGEVLSAVPLVKAMGRSFCGRNVVFSASTLSGFEIAGDRLRNHVAALFYYPYDFLFSVKRIAGIVNPALVIIVETDTWPNFLFEMKRRHVPTLLVNARLSRSSFKGYRSFRGFFVPMFATFTGICAQSETDAGRFRRLGMVPHKVSVTGNLKFDQGLPCLKGSELERLKTCLHLNATRPVIVAGSTHPGEEANLLDAFSMVKRRFADGFLVIVPRNPERAGDIFQICRDAGFSAGVLHDADRSIGGPRLDVGIVATMGVLNALYDLSDIAFVGGSMVQEGGHNPLEPAACSKPVLFGEDMSDFAEIARMLLDGGGAIQIKNVVTLAEAMTDLLATTPKRRRMGANALAVYMANRGAVEKTVAVIERCLP